MKLLAFSVFLSTISVLLSAVSSNGISDEDFSQEVSRDPLSSLDKILIQQALKLNNFGDRLRLLRESGPKRANVIRFEELPPGFAGVRGKKSEKTKTKDPVPGFLGVRGKKSSSMATKHGNDYDSNIARYIRREFYKFNKE